MSCLTCYKTAEKTPEGQDPPEGEVDTIDNCDKGIKHCSITVDENNDELRGCNQDQEKEQKLQDGKTPLGCQTIPGGKATFCYCNKDKCNETIEKLRESAKKSGGDSIKIMYSSLLTMILSILLH